MTVALYLDSRGFVPRLYLVEADATPSPKSMAPRGFRTWEEAAEASRFLVSDLIDRYVGEHLGMALLGIARWQRELRGGGLLYIPASCRGADDHGRTCRPPVSARPEGAAVLSRRERGRPDELTAFGGLLHAPDGSNAKIAAIVACHCGTLGHDAAAAYGSNYARLQQLKATYDPDNVLFHMNQNIRLAR